MGDITESSSGGPPSIDEGGGGGGACIDIGCINVCGGACDEKSVYGNWECVCGEVGAKIKFGNAGRIGFGAIVRLGGAPPAVLVAVIF